MIGLAARRPGDDPELPDVGLLLRARAAGPATQQFDLVVIGSPLRAREGWWWRGAKLVRPRHQERPRARPVAEDWHGGRNVAAGHRKRAVRAQRRGTVVGPRGDHVGADGRTKARAGSARFARGARADQRLGQFRVEHRLLVRKQAHQNGMRRPGHGRVCGDIRRGFRGGSIGRVAAFDGVDGVVHRAMKHGHAAGGQRRRLFRGDDRLDRGLVPVEHGVGLCERARQDHCHRGNPSCCRCHGDSSWWITGQGPQRSGDGSAAQLLFVKRATIIFVVAALLARRQTRDMGPHTRQFCPIAKAAEIICERWTLLVVRELLLGSRHFNDFQRGLPMLSPTLLTKRLRSLEESGVLVRAHGVHGTEYRPTLAAKSCAPSFNSLATGERAGYAVSSRTRNSTPAR